MFRLPLLLSSTLLIAVLGLRKGVGKQVEVAVGEAEAEDAAGLDTTDYGGDGSDEGDHCVANWTDVQKFDCQLYEGAGWCDKSKFLSMGYGWCHRRSQCSQRPIARGGWALEGAAAWGWGTFKAFANNRFKFTARQVCAGCGAKCPQKQPKRKLNPIKDGCMDYSAPNGQVWRGPSGYTCGAYHHGGFCRWQNNQWVNGPLMKGYGRLPTYRHWAMHGSTQRKMHPLQACCTCGGGCQCTNGWKAPKISQCVREFEYKGKGYSGCTTAANPQVRGGGAWCAHDKKYKAGKWSKCIPCEAGWQPKPGSKCSSEFTFNGKKFSGCTRRSPNQAGSWCAHDAIARGNRWSQCEKCRPRR